MLIQPIDNDGVVRPRGEDVLAPLRAVVGVVSGVDEQVLSVGVGNTAERVLMLVSVPAGAGIHQQIKVVTVPTGSHHELAGVAQGYRSRARLPALLAVRGDPLVVTAVWEKRKRLSERTANVGAIRVVQPGKRSPGNRRAQVVVIHALDLRYVVAWHRHIVQVRDLPCGDEVP